MPGIGQGIGQYFLADFAVYASLFSAVGLTALAIWPAVAYFQRGWEIKKTDIVSSFSWQAKILYLNTFFNLSIGAREKDRANDEFERIYQSRYGQKRYIFPLVLFVICCLIATYLFCQSGIAGIEFAMSRGLVPLRDQPHASPLLIIPDVAASGVAGAYLWIVADTISSTRRLNFSPADLLNATLRLSMSASISFALVGTVSQPGTKWFALTLAFAVGAFPLSMLRAMFRRYANNTLKLADDTTDDPKKDRIDCLDGVDPTTADRLLDADISTVLQLAYADPVQLSMRTGIDFAVVTDLASQALAWIYFGERLRNLRCAGLRGAMEIRFFLEQLEDANSKVYDLSESLLTTLPDLFPAPTAADGVKAPSRAAFLNACDEIANDPYTEFLVEIWRDHGHSRKDIVPVYAKLLKA